MNFGTSMWVGQARVQGASKQYRQRAASISASATGSGGGKSANRSRNISRLYLSPALISDSKKKESQRARRTQRKKEGRLFSSLCSSCPLWLILNFSRLLSRQPLAPAFFADALVISDDLLAAAESVLREAGQRHSLVRVPIRPGLHLGVIDREPLLRIENRDIRVAAGRDRALARIQSHNLRRVG